jgi:glycosyltransferase 2 family protein
MTIKKSLLIIAKLLLSVFCLSYLINKFGHEIKLIAFDKLNYIFLLLSLMVFAISQLIAVWRWYICYFHLSPREAANYKRIFKKVYWIGLFSNNFLPASFGGDLVRAYILKSLIKSANWSYCLVSVFVDRAFGLLVLALLGLVVSIYIKVLGLGLGHNWTNIFILIFASILLGAIIFYYLIIQAKKFIYIGKKWFKWLNGRKIRKIVNSLQLVFINKILLFKLFLSSVLIQILVVLSIYLASLGLNMKISKALLFLLNPASTLGSLIVPSLNGLGVREGIYVYLFKAFNSSGGEAIILSAFCFITMLLISLPGSIFFLQNKNKKSWKAKYGENSK